MVNQEIRKAIPAANLKYWEVADALGVHSCTFSCWLRKELPQEKQDEILHIITELELKRS